MSGAATRAMLPVHDDTFSSRAAMPSWADWFTAAGVRAVGSIRPGEAPSPSLLTRATKLKPPPFECKLKSANPPCEANLRSFQ
jgi:hypothetical protein